MATDIRAIKALNDFPETPYEPTASQNVLEFRWIHGQCFQFRLPDGKVLMTDPFLPQNPKAWRRENTPVLDLNELGPVDYVTINHSHFDHTSDLPAVFKENSPIVICDRIFARELSAAYQVPEYNIWPIVPGMTYQFDSFRLDTVAGKHNDIGGPCDLEGARFGDPENTMVGPLNSYGCLFNTSFLFTLTNHYRIGFAAGVDVKGMLTIHMGADQHLTALKVFRQPPRGFVGLPGINRRTLRKALHHVVEHRAAVLVVEQLCIDEIIVDALGLAVDAADERRALPCGFLFLHDVEHHAAHGGAGLCAPLVVHKMYDGDTAHRPSMTDRSAALTSDSSCAAFSRPMTCTLPMLARTVRRLMLLPMPLSWRSSSFCSSMTTIRLPRQQAVT